MEHKINLKENELYIEERLNSLQYHALQHIFFFLHGYVLYFC